MLTNGSVNNIETRTATPLVFLTNGNEAARIDSGGKLLLQKAQQFQYNTASTDSRTWYLNNDIHAYGDFAFRRSTTQTGSTFETKILFKDTGGICFNGDTAAANALDDYEEGTFTPTIAFSNLSVSSYGAQQGSYIKVGRIVHVSIYIRFSGTDLSGTPQTGGSIYINLPVTAGTNYSDTQYISEPAAVGRLAEFRGANDSTDFDRIYHYIGNSSSSLLFGVNKQPASPQSTDFLHGMSEKSFSGLIGVSNNFEYRHSFTYEANS